MAVCGLCGQRAVLKRPKTGCLLCKNCFFEAFENEIHLTITNNNLFQAGEYVAIAASGGKDSTALAYVLQKLKKRYSYDITLSLISVDEGIMGYRDDSLETVRRNELQFGIPLKIISYKDIYGWTMDEIVKQIGLRNNCTFCGVFRRQALDRGAQMLGVNKIITVLRGDVARLKRCTSIITGQDKEIPRCKPFKYAYEKEIVMYAYFNKLDYFSTECIYSPNAYRGHVRTFLKDLEKLRPSTIIDIIHSGENFIIKEGIKLPTQVYCQKCKFISSQLICQACTLLEGLNKGRPRLAIGKSSRFMRN